MEIVEKMLKIYRLNYIILMFVNLKIYKSIKHGRSFSPWHPWDQKTMGWSWSCHRYTTDMLCMYELGGKVRQCSLFYLVSSCFILLDLVWSCFILFLYNLQQISACSSKPLRNSTSSSQLGHQGKHQSSLRWDADWLGFADDGWSILHRPPILSIAMNNDWLWQVG